MVPQGTLDIFPGARNWQCRDMLLARFVWCGLGQRMTVGVDYDDMMLAGLYEDDTWA